MSCPLPLCVPTQAGPDPWMGIFKSPCLGRFLCLGMDMPAPCLCYAMPGLGEG